MKTTLQLFTALFVALLSFQCTEEELLVSQQLQKDALQKANAKLRSNSQAFTIGAIASYADEFYGSDYDFYIGGGEGEISVNWGDGVTTTHQVNNPYEPIHHVYSANGRYPIVITGALEKITSFESYYGMAEFDAINFKRLTNLQEINIGLTASSSTLDLSQNQKLSRVSLAGMTDLEHLILPKKHNIRSINLDGPFKFDTKDVDGIIENVYRNTVSKNLTGGYFTLPAEWYHEEGDRSMVGPPSAASIEKLRILQNTYGWSIYPALDPPPNM